MAKYKKYPEYKDSGVQWCGEVPAHWPPYRFKHSLIEKKKTTNPELQAGSISFGKVIFKNEDNLDPSTKASYQEVLSGEFLINPLNMNYDLLSLRTALSDIDVVVSTGYIVIQNKNKLSDRFARWLLQQFDVAHMKTLGSGVRQTINYLDIGNSLYFEPPLPEQKQIARFLDHETGKIDRLIQKQQQLIELLKEKRQAVISHAVTKGLNPNAPLKPSNIDWLGEIPVHWEFKKIKTLFQKEKRQNFPRMEVLSVFRDHGVILKNSRKDNINKTPEDLSSYQLVEKSDLVINKMKCWQGSLGVSEYEGITSPDYMVYSPTHSELDRFIHHALRASHMPQHYKSISNGIRPDQWRLEPALFESFELPIPPRAEQEEITIYLDQLATRLDSLSEAADIQITLLQERRTALISAAVTGKIDVRDWCPSGGNSGEEKG